MRILSGILLHLFWKRSYTPICQLVLLIGEHLTVSLQEESQAKLLHTKCLGGLTSIKHVDDVEAKVTLKPLDISISSMKHLHYAWIIKYASECIT